MSDPGYGTEPRRLHRRDAPDTSAEAAHYVDTKGDERLIHDLVKKHGTLTSWEAAQILGRPVSSISGRFSALRDRGLIHDTGQRRRTPQRGTAIVWADGPPDLFSPQHEPKRMKPAEVHRRLRELERRIGALEELVL